MEYDYIIVGGGPSGMTLAWLFGSKNKKVLLLEKEAVLGGCHRVHRINGYFSEHGPRIYSDSYSMFIKLLRRMKIDFYHIFKKVGLTDKTKKNTKFNITKINNKTIGSFNFNEKKALFFAFIKLIINLDYGKDISLKKFADDNNFSDDSKDYLDKFCRLTDGAAMENYTLFQFLQILNQQMFYSIYQPKVPNDKGLILLWEKKLLSTGNVTIVKNADVIKINSYNKNITSIVALVKGISTEYKSKKYVLCVPPKPFYNLLNGSEQNIVKDSFGKLEEIEQWKDKNSYFDFIPLTFHYTSDVVLPKKSGFPQTPWGIGYIILSNYMDFTNEPSKKVISITITFTDKPNEEGKTVNQCSKQEIVEYVKKILNFPNPDKVIISQNVIREGNKWINIDTAYVTTTDNKYIDFYSKEINNLFVVGVFNGKSTYHFTSIESAVQNAVEFAKEEIEDYRHEFSKTHNFDLVQFIHNLIILIICIILLVVVKYYVYNKVNK